MLQLNGIVGGKNPIPVSPGQSRDLQIIVINVKKGQRLVLKRLNFLLGNEDFTFVVKALPSTGTFRARGGFGDLKPNKVLFHNNTGDDVLIFLAISAVNKAKNTLTLDSTNCWLLKLAQVC
ncbi:hypothetical protein [Brevibacillus sp. SYSU BS000544]|uniref:hypothetical protein n=1 Tax=Brevibacillus sp. SYSU BS000544 TaxID=3416443 RepID=UPI003CE4F674